MCNTVKVDNYFQLLQKLGQLNIQNTQIGESSFPLRTIMCAAEVSGRNSPIFVFIAAGTRGSVSDQKLLGDIEAIAAEKNLQINNIIVMGSSQVSKRSLRDRQIYKLKHSHYKRENTQIDIYQELADFSDGQNIQIPVDDISEIGPVITYSATQSSNTIFRYNSNATDGSTNFSVNSYAFEILICVSGQNINVSVYTPEGKHLLVMIIVL